MPYCCVPLCKSGERNKIDKHGRKITFHEFPSNLELRNKWIVAICRKEESGEVWTPHQYSHVCSRHFTNDDFRVGLKKAMLQPDAVPSVFEDYPLYMQRLKQGRKKSKNCEIASLSADNSNTSNVSLISTSFNNNNQNIISVDISSPDIYSATDIDHIITSKVVPTSKVNIESTNSTSANRSNTITLNSQNMKCSSTETEDHMISSFSKNSSCVPAISSVAQSDSLNMSANAQPSSVISVPNTNSDSLNTHEAEIKCTKSVAVEYSYVHSRHFINDDFKSGVKKLRLKPDAVPSVFKDYPLCMQRLKQERRKTKYCEIAPLSTDNSNISPVTSFNNNNQNTISIDISSPDIYSASDIDHLITSKDVPTAKVKIKNTNYTSVSRSNIIMLNLQDVKCSSRKTEDHMISSFSKNNSCVPAISPVTESDNLNMPVNAQSLNIVSVSNTNSDSSNIYEDVSSLEAEIKSTKSVAVNTEVTLKQLYEQHNENCVLREKLRLATRSLTKCKDKIRELEKVNKALVAMIYTEASEHENS